MRYALYLYRIFRWALTAYNNKKPRMSGVGMRKYFAFFYFVLMHL